MQETKCHVKRCTAPHFQRKTIRQNIRRTVCALYHIAGSHARGQQRLVGISHGRIRDEQFFLFQHPIAECARPLCI